MIRNMKFLMIFGVLAQFLFSSASNAGEFGVLGGLNITSPSVNYTS